MSVLMERRPAIFQPEDYLAVLTGISRANWCALAVMLFAQWWIRSSDALIWPASSSFTLSYNLIAAEYGLCNLALSLALHFRGWYERTPRAALNRLHQLTAMVLFWDGVHLLGAIEVTGGFHGPLVMVVPLMLAVSFFVLPATSARVLCAAMLLGLLSLAALQLGGVLYPRGSLGSVFAVWPEGSLLSLLILVCASIAGFLFGGRVFGRVAGVSGFRHVSRATLDPRYGCFDAATLRQRMAEELARAQRQSSAASLMIIRLHRPAEVVERAGLCAVEGVLAALARSIQSCSRLNLDTLAYLGDAEFGLLLPTADGVAARRVQERVLATFAQSGAEGASADQLSFGLASAGAADAPESAEAFERAARESLGA